MDELKRIGCIAVFGFLVLTGCSSTSKLVLDDTKRPPTSKVEVFKNGAAPTRSYNAIAEISYLGAREDELEAEKRFINYAKKVGGDGIVFAPVYAGVRDGTAAWLFKGTVIAYPRLTSSGLDADGSSAKAAAYFRKLDMGKVRAAAANGEPMAQFNLGMAYCTGQGGLPMDPKEGVLWFRKSADQGFAMGENALAGAYDEGNGVPQDSATALKWFLRAANHGYAPAQTSLGFKFANGWGAPQNFIEAYKWWSLAAAEGDDTALTNRDSLIKSMTAEQIAEGQKRASAFLARKD